ncbi:retropepsin-like aspartic protease [Sporosarcina sp. FSL W8-0480]|uniref:retropepsin-like aspartic protease n=1 Tax=Sporosarcina sp. FSL W8-0480 TaxID=2954701 RepID=UPI0030D973A6
MKLGVVNQLLEVEMIISYKNKSKRLDKLVVDTGAAHTLISTDIVEDLGIFFENGDPLVSSYGIGGVEYSFRKPVDLIKFGTHEIKEMKLDFGNLHEWGINGLIGLDILLDGQFIIDLKDLVMVQSE